MKVEVLLIRVFKRIKKFCNWNHLLKVMSFYDAPSVTSLGWPTYAGHG